uniref:Uncharacterized protein n=1 Tax=Anguilla anguilla TaxID=7936 RepID=A0A0E9VLM6_ANGAN
MQLNCNFICLKTCRTSTSLALPKSQPALAKVKY